MMDTAHGKQAVKIMVANYYIIVYNISVRVKKRACDSIRHAKFQKAN